MLLSKQVQINFELETTANNGQQSNPIIKFGTDNGFYYLQNLISQRKINWPGIQLINLEFSSGLAGK